MPPREGESPAEVDVVSRGRHRYIEPEPEDDPDAHRARHRYRPTQVHGPDPAPPARDLREETVADLFAAAGEQVALPPPGESAFSAHRVDDPSTPSRHSQLSFGGPGAAQFDGPASFTAEGHPPEIDPLEDTGRIAPLSDHGVPFEHPSGYAGRYRIYDGIDSDTAGSSPLGGTGGVDAVETSGGHGAVGLDAVGRSAGLEAVGGPGGHGVVGGTGGHGAVGGTGGHGAVGGTGGHGAVGGTGGHGAVGGTGGLDAVGGTGGHRAVDDASGDDLADRVDERSETVGLEEGPDNDGARDEAEESVAAAEEDADDEPGHRRRMLRLKVLAAVAAVSLLACVPLGFAAWRASGSAELENRAFLDAATTAEVAGQVSDAMIAAYSYDFRNMAASESEARAVITGDFVAEFTRNFEPLKKVAVEQQLVLQTTVPIAGLTDLRGDTARLLMMVNQHGTKGAAKEPIAVNAPLVVEARKVDGRWKIARVSPQ